MQDVTLHWMCLAEKCAICAAPGSVVDSLDAVASMAARVGSISGSRRVVRRTTHESASLRSQRESRVIFSKRRAHDSHSLEFSLNIPVSWQCMDQLVDLYLH